jgi:Ca2+-transporting ATPase
LGSSTEGSLLILGAKTGLFKEDLPFTRVEEMPFDPKRKMMSVLYKEQEENLVYAKGAPESIIERCSFVLTEKGVEKLTSEKKEEIKLSYSGISSEGLRSLAFAYKSIDTKNKNYDENNLIFIGITGIEDPPREEVAHAIALCHRSGIAVKMVTGDFSETAKAIARQIGLEGESLEGRQIDELSDNELAKIVQSISIFSRVQPEHKIRIVKALKANGEIVTMTGDGVNDAPALKEAHIGVAMGIKGTDVSRSVADITLKDDNFATIVVAIKEGRTIFNNIRKFVTYQLSCNLSDIYILFIGMLVAPFLGWFIPIISAIQILFMNIVTDNLPAITLGFNPTSKDIMEEKPRKNREILTPDFINLIILNGVTMGMIAFCVTFYSFNVLSLPSEVARTTVLVSMIFMQIANAFNFRSFRYGVLTRSPFVNKYLVFASLISVMATVFVIYSPASRLFETAPLGIESWLIAALSALLIVAIFDMLKAFNKRTNILFNDSVI